MPHTDLAHHRRLSLSLLGGSMLLAGLSGLTLLALRANLTALAVGPMVATLYSLVGIALIVAGATFRRYDLVAKLVFYVFSALAIIGIVSSGNRLGFIGLENSAWITYAHALVGMAGAAIGWPKAEDANASFPDPFPDTLPTFGEYQDRHDR